jgi:hypothetical protein
MNGYVSTVVGVVGCDCWGGGVCWGINYWGCRMVMVNVFAFEVRCFVRRRVLQAIIIIAGLCMMQNLPHCLVDLSPAGQSHCQNASTSYLRS